MKITKEDEQYIHEIEIFPTEEEPLRTLSKMYCFHGRYLIGDRHKYKPNMFKDFNEFRETLMRDYDIAIIRPLYLYDHSWLRIKIGSFQGLLPQGHAEFDSGQVGYVFVTKEDIRKFFNVERISKKILDQAEEIMKAEVSEYDLYISGQLLEYVITKTDKNTNERIFVDACSGFADIESMKETVPEEYEKMLDTITDDSPIYSAYYY